MGNGENAWISLLIGTRWKVYSSFGRFPLDHGSICLLFTVPDIFCWSAIQLCTCNSVNFQLGFLKEIQVILSLSLAFSPFYFIYFESMLFLHPIWQTDKGLKHTEFIQISWSWMTWSRTETLLQPALWEELISLSLLDIRESTPEQLWKPGSTDSVGQITIYI